MAVGSFVKGKLARERSPRSMKLPITPESMRAVVSTICFPTSSFIGKRRVRSLSGATSTWARFWEGNIEVSSLFKNPSQG